MSSKSLSSIWSPPSWVVMGLALVGIFSAHLVLSFFAALSSFTLIRALSARLQPRLKGWAVPCAVGASLLFIVLSIAGIFSGLGTLFDNQAGMTALIAKMTEALALVKSYLPSWAASRIPPSSQELFAWIGAHLQGNLEMLPGLGKEAIAIIFELTAGLFIGTMIAIRSHSLYVSAQNGVVQPLDNEVSMQYKLQNHLRRLSETFEKVVFAQVYIALINAIFTGVFLVVVLPVLGFPLPLTKTLVLLTFVLGLVPILGNLLSNTAILLVALSVDATAALITLVFLVVIHKLEYFLNAWIVGSKLQVKAYELLAAMLVFEALFGLPGLVAAPVLYAYIKTEASAQGFS